MSNSTLEEFNGGYADVEEHFNVWVRRFETKYPNGMFSVKTGMMSKKEAKERGKYEAYVCNNLNIGTPSFISGMSLGFTPRDALQKAQDLMESKIG